MIPRPRQPDSPIYGILAFAVILFILLALRYCA